MFLGCNILVELIQVEYTAEARGSNKQTMHNNHTKYIKHKVLPLGVKKPTTNHLNKRLNLNKNTGGDWKS